jgi:hypothetical protein
VFSFSLFSLPSVRGLAGKSADPSKRENGQKNTHNRRIVGMQVA